jgi:hypothetical protein
MSVRAKKKRWADPYQLDPYASVSLEWYQLPVIAATFSKVVTQLLQFCLTTDITHMDRDSLKRPAQSGHNQPLMLPFSLMVDLPASTHIRR